MRQYDPKKPLISIHIPKCGGTSFRNLLKKWFGRRFYKHYYHNRKNQMPKHHNLMKGIFSSKGYKEKVCVHGHFNKDRGFGIKDYYPDVDQYITILRDPLETAISNYYFIKKRVNLGKAYYNGQAVKLDIDVNEFLVSRKSHFLLHLPEMTMDNYKDVLNDFVYVGILEDMQKSVDNMARLLGYPSHSIGHVNISKRDENVSDEAREAFVKKNSLEVAIYNYAKEIYDISH